MHIKNGTTGNNVFQSTWHLECEDSKIDVWLSSTRCSHLDTSYVAFTLNCMFYYDSLCCWELQTLYLWNNNFIKYGSIFVKVISFADMKFGMSLCFCMLLFTHCLLSDVHSCRWVKWTHLNMFYLQIWCVLVRYSFVIFQHSPRSTIHSTCF